MSLFSFGRSDPRWLVLILLMTALAAAAASVAVWFLLPLVDIGGSHPFESEASRLVVVMVIVVLWGATNALLRARQNSANQARLDALDRQEFERTVEVDTARQAAEAEYAAIRSNARYAFRLAHGRRFADRLLRRGRSLPRYLVIGPAGSGKTTVLESANLTLPFDPRENERMTASACRFVVSDGAVFVDVAGDLALGVAEDRVRLWQRLLGLLHGARRLRPVNGVIVVVAASSLAALSEEERADLARTLRRRLDDVTQRLRARVPVFLLLSKLDRIRGFAEFFEHLGGEERTQVWGVPIEEDETEGPQPAHAAFGEEFDDLVRRASTRQLELLNAEPDEMLRIQAFEFPSQFAVLRDRLAGFLDELLRRSRFDEPPMLRGVFLTSALQDGSSGDSIGAVLAPTFAIRVRGAGSGRAQGGSGRERARRRPYFLKRLFSEVILADADAGGLSEGARRSDQLRGYAIRAAAALILVLGAIQVWSSYRRADGYVSDVLAASDRFRDDGAARVADFTPKLEALNNLARIEAAAEAPVPPGFHVAEPVLGVAQSTYRRGLDELLLPPTLRTLEALMVDPATTAADCFESLKLYLLLGKGLSPPAALLRDLGPRIAAEFAGLAKDAATRQQLADHVAALATVPLPEQDLDQRLVAQTRRRLNAITVAQIGYEMLRRDPALLALKPWRPIDHAGSLGPRAIARLSGKLLSSGLPGLFVAAAIGDVADASAATGASLAADGWVFSLDAADQPNLSKRAIQAGILNLYQAEYVRVWEGLLSDLTVPTLPTAAAGAELIAILNGQDAPLLQLLGAVAAETNLDRRVDDKLAQGAKPLATKLAGLGSPFSIQDAVPLTSTVRKTITAQFAGLRDALAHAKEGQPSEVEAILKGFDPLYKQLLLVAAGTAPADAEPSAANAALLMAAINRLPVGIRPYFLRLAGDASGLVRVNQRGRAAQLWAETVRPVCAATIAKAFPFDLSAPADVPLGEFTRVFSPNGLIATFRRTQLAALVDTNVRPWRWRDSRAAPSDPPDPTLAMFERAEAITAAFFTEGDKPGVRFTATPLKLDNTITKFQLDIGGASLVYAHGPVEPFIGQWPPPIGDAPATLSVQPEVDNTANALVGTGPWGLFRLFAQASKVAQKPDAMLFAFSLGRRYVRLSIATPTLRTAFDLQQPAGFTCPEF